MSSYQKERVQKLKMVLEEIFVKLFPGFNFVLYLFVDVKIENQIYVRFGCQILKLQE